LTSTSFDGYDTVLRADSLSRRGFFHFANRSANVKRLLNAIGGFMLIAFSAVATAQAENALDKIVAREQQKTGLNFEKMPVVKDAVFLRRVYVDLIGRIPTETEVRKFASQPAETRRNALIEELLKDERFADRWTLFYADMLRLRSQATGGSALIAYVHNAIKNGMPYDEMCRKLIASNGKAGRVPEAGFILGDDADPMAMASITSQVFLGVRMGCAQCHDHPFDEWKRRDFYDLAAYYGKTRRFESQLTKVVYATETNQSSVLWPPEGEGPANERKPIPPKFPFAMNEATKSAEFVKRLQATRTAKLAANKPVNQGPSLDDLLAEASEKVTKTTSGKIKEEMATAEAKKDIRQIDVSKGLYLTSEQREELAALITDTRNPIFSRALVNRVWKTLIGRGFVEPVDDFRKDNPPALPLALDYLAEEFIAHDYDLRALVRLVVTSDAYQRAHAPADVADNVRTKMEANLFATPVRRMIAESLYDSIVTAGHLYEPKYSAGKNEKTIYETVRIAKAGGQAAELSKLTQGSGSSSMMAMNGKPMQGEGNGYALESAIELDFNALLKEQGEEDEKVAIAEMKVKSKEELEAERIAQMKMTRTSAMEYEEKKVAKVIDDNPVFNSSLRMPSPAPEGHFLRIFGQPNRSELGDLRQDNASMRQALMMLNGRVTHEASRVGDLEPLYKLITVKTATSEEDAIKLAYMEILTRRPTVEEMAEAKTILRESTSPLEGIADLRWILLNCNEFRFLP
jgi:hypothetical protein